MRDILRDNLKKGEDLRVLIAATGPSIFYNIDKIKAYIEKYNPIIIGINGYLHGLLELQGKIFEEVNPLGVNSKIDFTDIDRLIPDIFFTFLKYNERHTIDGRLVKQKIGDLFGNFIESHKDFVIKNNITMMYPSNKSIKVSGKFRQADWHENCYDFDLNPDKYKSIKDRSKYKLDISKKIFDDSILFKVKHGGEYVLAWVLAQNPDMLATCGILDFPRKKIKKQRRGWFWLNTEREMPSKMSVNQSVIIKFIHQKFGNKYTDLNLEPWT